MGFADLSLGLPNFFKSYQFLLLQRAEATRGTGARASSNLAPASGILIWGAFRFLLEASRRELFFL